MSKLKRCLYIINLLKSEGSLSLQEVNEHWKSSNLFDGGTILPRTFLRYREFISDTFPYYIEYNHRTGKYELIPDKLYREDYSSHDYLLSTCKC